MSDDISPWLKILRNNPPVGRWIPENKFFYLGHDDQIQYKYNPKKGILKCFIKKPGFIIARIFGVLECTKKRCTCGGCCILREPGFADKVKLV